MASLWLVLGITGILLSYVGVALIRRLAETWRIIDIPNLRSSHTRPTPRGGGLVIVVITLGGLLVMTPAVSSVNLPILLSYIVGAAGIAVVSWLDDRHPLSNRLRFGIHSLGAVLALSGISMSVFGSVQWAEHPFLGVLSVALTFIWIVGLTNAYNFMDGIDGIAGCQAVIAATGWATVGWMTDQPFIVLLGTLLASSSLGFLVHNWAPARIFMGDVGSAFLGYTFAIMPLLMNSLTRSNPPTSNTLIISTLVVWPFIFDSVSTFLRRWRNGENVFSAHRSHLYQRLTIAGCSHRAVTVIYAGLACIGMVLAIAWQQQVTGIVTVTVVFISLAAMALWLGVLNQERRYRMRTSTVSKSSS